jgi:hypothetical protein
MFRNRVRPPTPPLDEVTAERLLRGEPIEDLPDAYRPLGLLLADATGPATEEELAGSVGAAAEFVAAHDAATAPRRRTRSMAGSVLLAFALAASTGTAVAATQGALPEPIQQVAHEALGAVGIDVPGTTKADDGGGGDGSVDTTPAVGVDSHGTPSTTPPAAVGAASVPATTPNEATPGAATNPATTEEHQPGAGGDNPDTGQGTANPGGGNPGGGNPGGGNPGGGNAGNPDPNDQGNQGNQGNGNQGNQGNHPVDPGTNLPPQSNGNGNGPPQVPPGQAKKLG